MTRTIWLGLLAVVLGVTTASGQAVAQQQQEAQHPLHHGRRHRLDAARHLP